MKVLIIRFSSIGDIVLTTPVIRCLKKQVAGLELHYLTKKAFRPIVEHNPYIDKHFYLEEDWDALIGSLKKEDYDSIIDLHHNLRSLRVKKALKKKSFSFNKLNIEKWLYTRLRINQLPDAHIVDRYLATVAGFGVRNDGAGLDYFISKTEEIKEGDIPATHLAGFIGVVIGAAMGTKKYPLAKLKELCASLDHPVILLGGPEDEQNGDLIAAIDPAKIYNACGRFSLNESADLVKRARLIVTNDTGLMHIAAAYKRPVISLWGNTVPAFGMYPYYGDNYLSHSPQLPYDIMEINNLWCRPCSKIGYSKCPLGHFKCMELIAAENVLERINARIGRK